MVLSALTMLAGCGDDAQTPDAGADAGPADARLPDAPVVAIGETPLWLATGDPAHQGTCFGDAVALADIDGDGHRDVLVTAPHCGFTSTAPDRLAIFRGTSTLPEQSAQYFEIDWDNANPLPFTGRMAVVTGQVDGDGAADVLVSSRNGAALFLGKPDLAAMFTAPVFRVTDGGALTSAVLADVNADGRADVVAAQAGSTRVYLAAQQPDGAPVFTESRTLEGSRVALAGDLDGNGAAELLVTAGAELRLHAGCPAAMAAAECEGGVSLLPVWTLPGQRGLAGVDMNGDGNRDVLVLRDSAVHLHLGGADGKPAASPVWSTLGDPLFPLLGQSMVEVGDMAVGGAARDVAVAALGRVYLFTAAGADALAPAWAWPRADVLGQGFGGYFQYALASAGDLNRDGVPDLAITGTKTFESSSVGMVALYAGGTIPADLPAPYLPAPRTCEPAPGDPGSPASMPDLGVDDDVLGRSLFVEHKEIAADSCEVTEGCVTGTGMRRLLRFSVSIPNLGAGPALIPGPETQPDLYRYDQCHGHDHLLNFASYELADEADTVVVTGRKQGFYLVDYTRYCSNASDYVGDHYPNMGISAGWADVYIADYACQWLDVTEVADGTYTLRIGVNQTGLIPELGEQANVATVRLELQGDRVTVLP